VGEERELIYIKDNIWEGRTFSTFYVYDKEDIKNNNKLISADSPPEKVF
jgi:hypothetical protein